MCARESCPGSFSHIFPHNSTITTVRYNSLKVLPATSVLPNRRRCPESSPTAFMECHSRIGLQRMALLKRELKDTEKQDRYISLSVLIRTQFFHVERMWCIQFPQLYTAETCSALASWDTHWSHAPVVRACQLPLPRVSPVAHNRLENPRLELAVCLRMKQVAALI